MSNAIKLLDLAKQYIDSVNDMKNCLGAIKITEYNKWFMLGQRVTFEGKKYNLTLKKGSVYFEIMAGDHIVKGSDCLTIGYYDEETGTGLNPGMIDEDAYTDIFATTAGVSSYIGSEYFIMDNYFIKIAEKLRKTFGDAFVDDLYRWRYNIVRSSMILYFIHQDFFPNRETEDMRPLMVATYIYEYCNIFKAAIDLTNEDAPELDTELAQITLDLECESRNGIIPAYPFIIRTIFRNIIKPSGMNRIFYLRESNFRDEIYRYWAGHEVSQTDLELKQLHDAYGENSLSKIDCLDISRYDTWRNHDSPNKLTVQCIAGEPSSYLGFRINVDRIFDNTKYAYYSNGIFNFETLFTGNIQSPFQYIQTISSLDGLIQR